MAWYGAAACIAQVNGCCSVAQKQHLELTRVRFTCCRVAAEVGRDSPDQNGVNPASTQDRFELRCLETANMRLRIGCHASELRRALGFFCEVRQHLRRLAALWHDAVVHGQAEQAGASGQDGGGAAQALRRVRLAPRYDWGLKVGEEDLNGGGVEHGALLSCGRPQRSH